MRIHNLIMAGLLICGAIALAPATAAQSLETHRFDIKPQSLASALLEFSRQADRQVVGATDALRAAQTAGVTGNLSVDDALAALLEGTGLEYQLVGERSVRIVVADRARAEVSQSGMMRFAESSESPQESAAGSEESKSEALEEIIVTAQKRVERLQDVPVAVTALSGADLLNRNQLLLQDYSTSVPGLSLVNGAGGGQSQQLLAIRGITTGAGSPGVGVTVDDVPFGASTFTGGGNLVPDLDPGELARVEVLRGPQGTLYGASSLGGLLKFVTVDPSTDRMGGYMQGGLSSTQNGDGVGYNLRGSINAPLGDAFAVRASAFTRKDAGYLDDPILNIQGINEARINGGRLSALWKPSEAVSLKLSALYQKSEGDGPSDVTIQPGLGDLQQNHLIGTGAYERELQSYSATLNAKFAGADLTSITAYSINAFNQVDDVTQTYGALAQLIAGIIFNDPNVDVSGASFFGDNETRKFTQELRALIPLGRKIEWLVGAFYTQENSSFLQDVHGINPVTGADAFSLLSLSFPTEYEEYAAFTNLTFHVTDRFDVQMGGRSSRLTQITEPAVYGGVLARPTAPGVRNEDKPFTYLLTPQFKLSSDMMVYARMASGFRAGGGGSTGEADPCHQFNYPCSYSPDTTQSYELGLKGNFFDRILSVDASLYYIDWKDIQVDGNNPGSGLSYIANGGHAVSKGVELSVVVRPLEDLTVSAWTVYDHAVLTEDVPPDSTIYGVPGDRLPLSSRVSGYLALNKDFRITNGMTAFVGSGISYVGNRKSGFASIYSGSDRRETYPPYSVVNLRAGVNHEGWQINLFANNVLDRRGVIAQGRIDAVRSIANYVTPRTIGLSATRSF